MGPSYITTPSGGIGYLVQGPPQVLVTTPGPPGTPGTSGDYGFIVYNESAGAAPVLYPAGVRTRLTFTPDPAQTLDQLTGPFIGHTFWDGAAIRPRAVGDDAVFRLTLSVSSMVIGGSVLADVDIGGSAGIIGSDNRVLTYPAGSPETVRFLFVDYFMSTYLQNGGALYLTPSVPIQVTNESLVFYPRGAAS